LALIRKQASVSKFRKPHACKAYTSSVSKGPGKSGLIENLIIQDIKQGVGVGLLDPHGDLTQAVLSRLPDRRLGDVIYLDITDYRYPLRHKPFRVF